MRLWVFIGISLVFWACGPKDSQEDSAKATIKSDTELMNRAIALSEKGFGRSRLSEYGFFETPMSKLKPAHGLVLPYSLNTPLFTDYADKERFIVLPNEEAKMVYDDRDVLQFPEGTIIVKNFLYEKENKGSDQKRRVVETRLLQLEQGEWNPISYVWNEEQSEAYLSVTGARLDLAFEHAGVERDLTYKVPTINQCKSCHMLNGGITPLGPSVRQLHRDEGSHVVEWIEKGYLKGAPDSGWPKLAQWDQPHERLNDRARAYLDINCGTCHRPGGPAKTSGLDLSVYAQDGYELGIGKKPVAAGKGSGGRLYDIVPGAPQESILLYRMESLDPGVMMPELGRSSVHREGVELIRAWIEEMEENKQISLIFAPN
ncbi:hypothetical protein HZ996_09400 [Cryomorphaceae bacterium]|nr:hypothetical protein HZ996_09400 [Cryomorphaceae bacterium]